MIVGQLALSFLQLLGTGCYVPLSHASLEDPGAFTSIALVQKADDSACHLPSMRSQGRAVTTAILSRWADLRVVVRGSRPLGSLLHTPQTRAAATTVGAKGDKNDGWT